MAYLLALTHPADSEIPWFDPRSVILIHLLSLDLGPLDVLMTAPSPRPQHRTPTNDVAADVLSASQPYNYCRHFHHDRLLRIVIFGSLLHPFCYH